MARPLAGLSSSRPRLLLDLRRPDVNCPTLPLYEYPQPRNIRLKFQPPRTGPATALSIRQVRVQPSPQVISLTRSGHGKSTVVEELPIPRIQRPHGAVTGSAPDRPQAATPIGDDNRLTRSLLCLVEVMPIPLRTSTEKIYRLELQPPHISKVPDDILRVDTHNGQIPPEVGRPATRDRGRLDPRSSRRRACSEARIRRRNRGRSPSRGGSVGTTAASARCRDTGNQPEDRHADGPRKTGAAHMSHPPESPGAAH